MSSPLGKYPVFLRKPFKDNSWIIIAVIAVVIFAAAVGFVVYIVRRQPSTATRGRCEPGLCKLDLLTGIKTCPEEGDTTTRLIYDLALEGCTSRNWCQWESRPCAVQPSGILDCDGRCNLPGTGGNGNNQCRCLAAPLGV